MLHRLKTFANPTLGTTGLRNDETFSLYINIYYTSIQILRVLFLPCVATKTTWLISCFNKSKLFLRDCYINVMYYANFSIKLTKTDFFFITHFYCYVTMIHFAFQLQIFFNPNISETIQAKRLTLFVKLEKLTTFNFFFKK